VRPQPEDLDRYRANYLRESEGVQLYRALAKAESDPHRAEIFEKLALAEERHCRRWIQLLADAGEPEPTNKPNWRVGVLSFLARKMGTDYVLPVIGSLEAQVQDEYAGQEEAGTIPAEERSHRRALHAMNKPIGGADAILGAERWHRASYGGSLRAAVFGMNDGLVSNFGLVMGVAGANVETHFILLAGTAGLLAGALSMAAGEYVSVTSQKELYEQQIALEEQELEASPDEEREELSLIYQAKGIPEDQAEALATRIISDPEQAIQTLAREELGLDPTSLGSPWAAAGSSLLAFGIGATVPVFPYLFLTGNLAIIVSASASAVALFGAGALISIFTGRSVLFSGGRMVGIGALAAATTYAIGMLLGIGGT
jgi:VIT1/CCC1 family predicted Fe2+/Mn2+ transporter